MTKRIKEQDLIRMRKVFDSLEDLDGMDVETFLEKMEDYVVSAIKKKYTPSALAKLFKKNKINVRVVDIGQLLVKLHEREKIDEDFIRKYRLARTMQTKMPKSQKQDANVENPSPSQEDIEKQQENSRKVVATLIHDTPFAGDPAKEMAGYLQYDEDNAELENFPEGT